MTEGASGGRPPGIWAASVMRRCAVGWLLALGLLAVPSLEAQETAGFPDFPGSRPLSLPAGTSPSPTPGAAEVELPVPLSGPAQALPGALRVRVDQIVVLGNTVFSSERLGAVGASFVGRELEGEALQTLQGKLTELYVSAGFVNSRAVLPDQDFEGGVLRVQIVEGRLADVVIQGTGGYSPAYLREQLMGPPGRPLNAFALESRIRRLQADPGIRSLKAVLRPGFSREEAILFVDVSESNRLSASVEAGDILNPTIGEMAGYLTVGFLNPIAGRGDRFGALFGLSEGLTDLQLEYALPVGRYGTALRADFRYSQASIVDEGLKALDFRSRYMAAGLTVSQPLWKADGVEVETGLRTEWRQSRSTAGGFPWAFSDAADADGNVRDFVFRFYQALVVQDDDQAFAFRSTWNFGTDALGATSGPIDRADFVSWLGQGQWLGRLEGSGINFLVRGNVQVALDPLVPFERFSVGGSSSVRGYRQNQEVRDSGYSLRVDARFPLIREPSGRTVLRVGPFVDSGRSWTTDRGENSSHVQLASVGVEAVWSPSPRLRFEFIYGYRLLAVAQFGETALQDHGIEFRIVAATF
ncbi:MAG: BamA/TamA family outer membrane protein [Myxococcota bacterium]|nr:BamA/TamA family outer membrane protein [Myxococcota bacterium]